MDDEDNFMLAAAMAGDTTFRWMADTSSSMAGAIARSIYATRESEEARRRDAEADGEYGKNAPPPDPKLAAVFDAEFQRLTRERLANKAGTRGSSRGARGRR